MNLLDEIIIFLLAAIIAVPLFRRLGLGAVLGYLTAGVVIGPWSLGLIEDTETIMRFAEFGVVMLLFVIGLELQLSRLWALRRAIVGFGAAQWLITGVLLAVAVWFTGATVIHAALIGLVMALSSTAFALQLMAERGELTTRYGRIGFANLLFQDLAAVPLIALVPLLGAHHIGSDTLLPAVLRAILVLAIVVIVGRFLLRHVLRIAALAKVREILTATALLTVLGTAYLMEIAGLSMELGAFLAGVLLADSEFRHQLEADIEPFKGLLLGLFFISVGAAINLGLVVAEPWQVATGVLVLISIKFVVLFGLGKRSGLETRAARRLGLLLSQGGEFAFVIFGSALSANVLSKETVDLLTVIVSFSMAVTPLLLFIDDRLSAPRPSSADDYEVPDVKHNPVIIAGFGRFGQIIGRILAAKKIPFTALERSQEQVDFVKKYGNKIYHGDTSRRDLLEAAGADHAKIFILAIDDPSVSLRTAELVRSRFPNMKVYARARDRKHAHQLMDLGVEALRRETFLSALDLSKEVLKGLGFSEDAAQRSVERFKEHDLQRLYAHRDMYNDDEKMQELAKAAARQLEELFEQDARDDVGA
ncbi:MAG: monovalent cation:proton antiporter-2 (CPA2) family protein [Gammaproteobacteria bacterium]